MNHRVWCMLAALTCMLMMTVAAPAAADQRTISEGETWTLDNLGAEIFDVTITLVDSAFGTVTWSVVYDMSDGSQQMVSFPVNVFGVNPMRLRFQRPDAMVSRIAFTCTKGKVMITVECNPSGRGC